MRDWTGHRAQGSWTALRCYGVARGLSIATRAIVSTLFAHAAATVRQAATRIIVCLILMHSHPDERCTGINVADAR